MHVAQIESITVVLKAFGGHDDPLCSKCVLCALYRILEALPVLEPIYVSTTSSIFLYTTI